MTRLILLLTSLHLLWAGFETNAQTTRHALFLGNSYTAFNNLPLMVSNAALSAGDTLVFDSNTPGGFTLEGHAANTTSQNKIMAGGWDYVVLQGQSQEPVVQTGIFNEGGFELNELIKEYNPCAVPMLYMTWGRKNGDASYCSSFPVMCTYEGMDDGLKDAYLELAELIDAEVSPVSVVWRHLRENNPDIELYAGDESHPSAAGSYAAACSFYTAIFKKDPTAITYNYTIDANDAAIIRNAAKLHVYDSLDLWDFKQLPLSDFVHTIGAGINEVYFNPLHWEIAQDYFWDFGDGETSTEPNPTHFYESPGTYTVSLTTATCNLDGYQTSTSDTTIHFCNHTPTITHSEPLCQVDTLWTQPADSYQWYEFGEPIPETNQYLANYTQYPSSTFSVSTTIDGCTEVSTSFFANPEWLGYYFDSAFGGDPCEGDTALFTVHHFDGFLSGDEVIRWYQDDVLLPEMNDADTLFITEGGLYTVYVVNANSTCPLDSTSATVEYVCETVGIENNSMMMGKVYPNPASTHITLELPEGIEQEEVLIYNATGVLIKAVRVTSTATIDVADFPAGLYFIRLANQPEVGMRFVKE